MGRAQRNPSSFENAAADVMGFTEPVIGPATSGRTRWFNPSYGLLYQDPTLTSPPVATPRKCHVPDARKVLAVPNVSSMNWM